MFKLIYLLHSLKIATTTSMQQGGKGVYEILFFVVKRKGGKEKEFGSLSTKIYYYSDNFISQCERDHDKHISKLIRTIPATKSRLCQ